MKMDTDECAGGCARVIIGGACLALGSLFLRSCVFNGIESKLNDIDQDLKALKDQPKYEIRLTPEQLKELKSYTQVEKSDGDYKK